jgi:hypothetical protein
MENEVKTNPDEPIHPVVRPISSLYHTTGLTKREYFAAMALQALVTKNNNEYDYCVISAVKFADALIEELNKTNNNGKKL